MINILKAEFFKLKKNKSVLICAVIGIIYMVLSIALFLTLNSTLGGLDIPDKETVMSILPGCEGSNALLFFANDLMIFLILISIVFCSFYAADHKPGLVKNSLTAGYGRLRVYFAKLFMVLFVSVLVYVTVTGVYIAAYSIAGGWGGAGAGEFAKFWGLGLLQFLATAALVFMFSVLTKSTGATVGITIGLSFLFSLLGSLDALSALSGGGAFFTVLDEISRLFSGAQISYAAGLGLSGWRLYESVIVGGATLVLAAAVGAVVFSLRDQK